MDPKSFCRMFVNEVGFKAILFLGDEVGRISTKMRSFGIEVINLSLEQVVIDPTKLVEGLDDLRRRGKEFNLILMGPHIDHVDSLMTTILGDPNQMPANILVCVSGDGCRKDVDASRRKIECELISRGFRKHSSSTKFAQFENSTPEGARFILIFELGLRDHRYGVDSLDRRSSSQLIDDVLYESGQGSEDVLNLYCLASDYVRSGDHVIHLDAKSGFGCHVLKNVSPLSSIIGISSIPEHVNYAQATYAQAERTSFHLVNHPKNILKLFESGFDVIVCPVRAVLEFGWDEIETLIDALLLPGGRALFIDQVESDSPTSRRSGNNQLPSDRYLGAINSSKILSFEVKVNCLLEFEAIESEDAILRNWSVHVSSDCEKDNFQFPSVSAGRIIVACKAPKNTCQSNYINRMFSQEQIKNSDDTLLISEHYDNPWIFKSLIVIGSRISDPGNRFDMANEMLKTIRPFSADQGALLCIIGYICLENSCFVADFDLMEAIFNYAFLEEYENTTVLRWQISLSYLGGLLSMQIGKRKKAKELFARTMSLPGIKYSATILTKNCEAAFMLGCLNAADGNIIVAKTIWNTQIKYIRSLLSSYLSSEQTGTAAPFLYFEVGEVFALLGKIATALSSVDDIYDRPSLFGRKIAVSVKDQIGSLKEALSVQIEACDWHLQGKEILKKEILDKDEWINQLQEGKEWCYSQWRAVEAINVGLNSVIEDQKQWIETLLCNKSHLEQIISTLKLSKDI